MKGTAYRYTKGQTGFCTLQFPTAHNTILQIRNFHVWLFAQDIQKTESCYLPNR